LSALDWAAKIVEERGQELAESFLHAARQGDWRAADALRRARRGRAGRPPPRCKFAVRSPRFPARKRSALEWAAIAVEEHGREVAQSFVDAAKRGDWRAAEALMNRIYGKPEETVRQVEVNPATAVLKSMSLEEKLQLLHSLRRGDPSALRVVEAVPPAT
jgi:hypothetical protein